MTNSLAKLRILVTDNDPHMLSVMHSILHGIGIREITSARSSIDALMELKRREFDAVLITDDLAPHGGVGVTRKLRATDYTPNQRTPVILIAGKASVDYIEKARDAGVTEFIRKPVTGQIVQQRLQAILRNPRDFIAEEGYAGPDRRRRVQDAPPEQEKRKRAPQASEPVENEAI